MTNKDFPFLGIHKLFSGETSKDFSPLTSQWEDFVLDTLQHKAVLKVNQCACCPQRMNGNEQSLEQGKVSSHAKVKFRGACLVEEKTEAL